MRFLVNTKPSSGVMIPPEMMLGLFDAMNGWVQKYQSSFEQIWGTAGLAGGGGIVNVGSLEELDGIMAEFPFGPISEIEILPIVELQGALDRAKQAMQAMMPPAG